MEYNHPEDEELEDDYQEEEIFTCDPCDKYFPCQSEYEKHMLQHRVCNIDGCTFSAHEKIIEKHIHLQHSTGLYDKIKNVNTPEDISKWIEERKRRYPNKANIEKRYQKQDEQLKRGERITKSTKRFAENKHKLDRVRNKKNIRSVKKKKNPRPVKIEPFKNTEDFSNKMFPFKGTHHLYNEEIEVEDNKYEDEEWDAPNSENVVVLNNALGALMGAYMSDEFDDEPVTKVTPKSCTDELKTNDINDSCTRIETNQCEDEPPTEIKIKKMVIVDTPQGKHIENLNDNKNRKGRRTDKRNMDNRKRKGSMLIKTPGFHFKKRKTTLLEKLLESDIRRERNIILQCIRHIVNKDFFR